MPTGRINGDGVPTRELGKTGVHVSMVGLGGFHIGKIEREEEAIEIVRAAIDRGITFMDNCWDYHEGVSEIRMGKALCDGYRERVFLMSKLDGRSEKSAAKQIDESLVRLRTDRLDLIQFHEVIRFEDPDRIFAEEGSLKAVLAAKKAGKVRFVGFTGHKDPAIHLRMLDVAADHGFHFDTVQMPLNAFDAHFRSFEKNVVPRAIHEGIGVLGMKSMGAGQLLKSKTITAMECLHYAMNLPTSVVITGIDSMKILEQAISAAQSFRPLTEAQRDSILAKTVKAASSGAFESFKTTNEHDSTAQHPSWLG